MTRGEEIPGAMPGATRLAFEQAGLSEGGVAMAVVLTVKELSDYLKVPDSTIYRLASRGELPGFKMGDSWQFDLDEILEMIDETKKKEEQEQTRACAGTF